MWEISLSAQIIGFLKAIILGVIFRIVFDLWNSMQSVFKFSLFNVLFFDGILSAIMAITTFCYLLSATFGELRFYIFVGIFLGYVLVWFTISKRISCVFAKLLQYISSILQKFNVNIYKISCKACDLSLKKLKLFKNFLKKPIIFKKRLEKE